MNRACKTCRHGSHTPSATISVPGGETRRKTGVWPFRKVRIEKTEPYEYQKHGYCLCHNVDADVRAFVYTHTTWSGLPEDFWCSAYEEEK